jgi:AcrR family transcriptional regulator
MPHKLNKTKISILEAALTCFEEQGFDNTSISDIHKRSGASIGSIYHHFKSKAGIETALYIEAMDRYQTTLLPVAQQATSAEEYVKDLVFTHTEWLLHSVHWARYLLKVMQYDLPKEMLEDIHARNAAFLNTILRQLRSFREEGAIRPLPTSLYVPILVGPSLEFLRQNLATVSAQDSADIAQELAQAAWNSLCPHPNDNNR